MKSSCDDRDVRRVAGGHVWLLPVSLRPVLLHEEVLFPLCFNRSFLSVFLTTLFLILDVLSILAENWETKKGMMRVIAYIADILVLNMIYMYFMLDFVSEHHARIWGSLIVILRMLRLYTVSMRGLVPRRRSSCRRRHCLRTSGSNSTAAETASPTAPWI